MDNSILINKIYDHITSVTIKQNRLLDLKTLYGDGSIYENNKYIFEVVYNAIKNELNEKS